jgi:hypothetical protein
MVLPALVAGCCPGCIGGPVPAGATITALTLGLNLMPAYLDYQSRTVPAEFPAEYYGNGSEFG